LPFVRVLVPRAFFFLLDEPESLPDLPLFVFARAIRLLLSIRSKWTTATAEELKHLEQDSLNREDLQRAGLSL